MNVMRELSNIEECGVSTIETYPDLYADATDTEDIQTNTVLSIMRELSYTEDCNVSTIETNPDLCDAVIDIEDIPTDTVSNKTVHWDLLGKLFPKSEIVYFSQIIILYIIIIVSLVNLTIGVSDTNLCASALSGSLGYLLPSPTIRKKTYIKESK